MQTFKNKPFSRFANNNNLTDADLCEAVGRLQKGQIDADLGGGVIKQRIARKGGGKSRGFRVIVLFRQEKLAVFAYGFAKSSRNSLHPDELTAFKKLAENILNLSDTELVAAIDNRTIIEVICDDEKIQK